MLEYLNNIYVLPLFSTIIGLLIIFLYDKYEKKQYTSAMYLRFGLVIYISSFATFYISKLDVFTNLLNIGNIQKGGAVSEIDSQSMMPQPNDLKINLEKFKTGVPAF